MAHTLAVVGGGVIGLSIAWRAAETGWRVTLFDPAPASGASWVAGGMLAPLSEGWPGEEHLLELGVASLRRWDEFAARLDVPLLTSAGTLTVAFDAADATDLRTVADWVGGQGYAVEVLDRARLRSAEPSLPRSIRLGLLAPEERSVDNRAVLAALRTAADRAGVGFVAEAVTDVAAVAADRVVLCAGSRTAGLWPGMPIRPVKGEVLRLRRRPSAPHGPSRTIRARVRGRPVYLVPRADGVVVGATQYEHGDDTSVTVGGVRDLLADAEALVPGIGEYELAETAAGLRPVSIDNVPVIGAVSERVVVASGHGRNGILLAPLTVDAVLAALAGTPLAEAKHADPERFLGDSR